MLKVRRPSSSASLTFSNLIFIHQKLWSIKTSVNVRPLQASNYARSASNLICFFGLTLFTQVLRIGTHRSVRRFDLFRRRLLLEQYSISGRFWWNKRFQIKTSLTRRISIFRDVSSCKNGLKLNIYASKSNQCHLSFQLPGQSAVVIGH